MTDVYQKAKRFSGPTVRLKKQTDGRFAATIQGVTGYGDTMQEAIANLYNGAIEDGLADQSWNWLYVDAAGVETEIIRRY